MKRLAGLLAVPCSLMTSVAMGAPAIGGGGPIPPPELQYIIGYQAKDLANPPSDLIDLFFQGGGGSTEGYIVNYVPGTTPPANWWEGTIIQIEGASTTNLTIESLTAGAPYALRICSYYSTLNCTDDGVCQLITSAGLTLVTEQAESANVRRVFQDHLIIPYLNLIPYFDFLVEHPGIPDAIMYDSRPDDLRQAIWDTIAESESTSLAPAAGIPADYDPQGSSLVMYFTRDEAIDTYAAKIAHGLWLEMNDKLPWSISGYLDDDFADVFTFDGFLDFGANVFFQDTVVTFSPRDEYDLVISEAFSGGVPSTQLDAVHALLDNMARYPHLVHGSSSDPTTNTYISVADMFVEEVSRKGCHSATRYVIALARTVNIPGFRYTGFYAGAGHSTAALPTVDGVLAHGDDLYNQLLWSVPTDLLLDSHAYWLTDVVIYPEGDDLAGFNSMIHNALNNFTYGPLTESMQDTFCSTDEACDDHSGNGINDGWDKVIETFIYEPCNLDWPFLTDEEFLELLERLREETDSCSGH